MESKVEERIPRDILYDLISRFIINIPEDERKNMVRICFQIEIAHWFYLDWYCTEEHPHLKTCGMKEFTALILKHIPDMQHHLKNLDAILSEWREYKRAVPTYGAIVLDKNLTDVLLVQSFLAKSSWGFPKGKVNEEEPPVKCAVREVFEETGFDISSLINENEFIELTWNDQVTRLYLIPGVDKSTEFCPRTRMEIKAVEWFPLADLPAERKKSSKDATPRAKKSVNNPKNFFMVLPFVKKIRQWISQRQAPHQRHKSVSDSDVVSRPQRKDVIESAQFHKSISKQQLLFSTALQSEVQALETIRNQKASNSVPARTRGNGKKDRSTIKRQLFTGDEDKNSSNSRSQDSSGKQSTSRARSVALSRKLEQGAFLSNAWLNFQFDRAPIFSVFELPVFHNRPAAQVH